MAYTMPQGKYQYNPLTGRFEWTDGQSKWDQISSFLGSFSGQDKFDLGSLLGNSKGDSSFSMEGAPKNYHQPVQNMQSGWGMKYQSIGDNYNSALTDKTASSLGSAIGGEGGTNQLGADKAAGKFSGFLNGSSIGGGKGLTGGGGGMSKDPSAYIEAAKDIVGWSADIADSSKSKMSLPSQPVYHGENVHDLYGYNLLHKAPGATNAMASRKPGFLDSFTDINKKTVKGAMDGYNISNNWVGALVGGIIGTGFGLGNTFARLATHNRDLRRIRRYNDINQRNFLAAQNNAISNINTQYNTSMYGQRVLGNYGAYGGAMMPAYHANSYGLGGTVEPQELMGVTTFNAGGQHETNPNGGVMIGIGENGRPNLVEEGEVRWNDFIFSKRVKPTDEVLKKYNTFMRGGFASYADLATHILDMHKEREDSPFDKAAMNIQMQRLADAQEWEKLSEEAEENGMLPEEYQQYLQSMQPAEEQQMALGGNLFSIGGDTKGLRSGKGEDGMPYHKTTRVYYQQNNGSKGSVSDHAYVIEHYIDSLLAEPDGDFSVYYGKMLDKNGNPTKYTQAQRIELAQRAKKALEADQNAVYFMYDRIKELENAFGELQTYDSLPVTYQVGDRQITSYEPIRFGMGYAIDRLGDINIKYRKSGGEYGTDMKRTDIERQITNFKNSPASLDYNSTAQNTTNTQTPKAKTGGSQSGYSVPSYGGVYTAGYPRTDYAGNDWKPFVDARSDDGIVRDFTDYYNNKFNKNYSPDRIRELLSDHIVGPVHNEFAAFMKSQQTPAETPKAAESASGNQTEDIPDTAAPESQSDNTNAADETNPQNPNTNKLGLTPYDMMRLAPAYGALRSVLEQDPPDYTYSDQLASLYRPVSYRPTGQYMRYMPIDQHYLDTMANQQRNTMYGFYRNNAMTPAAANYYATLASTQAGSQAEQAYRNSVLQNNQNRNSVLQYNNQLDAMNENARMQAEQYNTQNYANIMAQSYGAAEQERLAVEAAREANRQNLYNNIGNIGRELSDRYYVSRNPALLYGPMGAYYKYLQQQNQTV